MFTEAERASVKADPTALERQNRRLERLKQIGVTRSTVLVHQTCKPAFEQLKLHFVDPSLAAPLAEFAEQLREKVTNVAQVRHLSLFRYPGGKTWLVPEARKWLIAAKRTPSVLVEPFAGGAMVGLTAAAENLAAKVVLSELDDDVAAVWRTVFEGSEEDAKWLRDRITSFTVNLANVREILDGRPTSDKAKAFRTIVKNRMQRGGIMSEGAGLVKTGENGRGLMSRWYPDTLGERLDALRRIRKVITFTQEDAFNVIERHSADKNAFFFVDPPYTAGGKNAGKRLYTHSEVDHELLFAVMSAVAGSVMMTYDDSPEVRDMARRHGFRVENVKMKNTHHEVMRELMVLKP
jgi:DNA adenine methylase